MNKLSPTLSPPTFQDFTYRCYICRDTGFITIEKTEHSSTYSYARTCSNGTCGWWKWHRAHTEAQSKKRLERFTEDDDQ